MVSLQVFAWTALILQLSLATWGLVITRQTQSWFMTYAVALIAQCYLIVLIWSASIQGSHSGLTMRQT